jgi:hypothetical protein
VVVARTGPFVDRSIDLANGTAPPIIGGISFGDERGGAATDVVGEGQAATAATGSVAARLSSMRRGAAALQSVASEFPCLLARGSGGLPGLRVDGPTVELACRPGGGVEDRAIDLGIGTVVLLAGPGADAGLKRATSTRRTGR